MKAENRIGTIINGWKILAVTGRRTKSKNALFVAECTKCGYVNHNIRLEEMKQYKGNTAGHVHKHRNKWTNKRLQNIWCNMKRRCYNVNNPAYKDYGARNITICDEWLSDNGLTFQDWALENGYRDDLTIDRIDVNGNYEPGNCRWITKAENSAADKRNSIYYTVGRYRYTASQWSRMCGYSSGWLRKARTKQKNYHALLNRLWEINWFFKNKSKPLTDEEIDEKYKEFLRDEGEPCEEDIREER